MAKPPKVVRPKAPVKHVANRKPRGPSRTVEQTVVSNFRCERFFGAKKGVCGRPATTFRNGQHLCPRCDPGPKLDPNCTHSLTGIYDGIERCSWCGGDLPEGTP